MTLVSPTTPSSSPHPVNGHGADQRAHPRAAFLQVPIEPGQLPAWAFAPVSGEPADATAPGTAGAPTAGLITGLVLNMGPGGLQVLTPAGQPLPAGTLDVGLRAGGPEGRADDCLHGRMRCVWSEALPGVGQLSGLAFVGVHSAAEEFTRRLQAARALQWVRCEIEAVQARR